jgi:hypothetical protein
LKIERRVHERRSINEKHDPVEGKTVFPFRTINRRPLNQIPDTKSPLIERNFPSIV